MSRYARFAQDILAHDLVLKLDLSSLHQVPSLHALHLQTTQMAAGTSLLHVSRQTPVLIRAKRSIAQFHLRQGQPVGWMVKIRGQAMYDVLDMLLDVAFARHRDFQGWHLQASQALVGMHHLHVFPGLWISGTMTVCASPASASLLVWSGFRIPVSSS